MIIQGRFIGDAPYFAARIRSAYFQGLVWLLADTGASRTTLLDRDVRLLGITGEALEPALLPIVGNRSIRELERSQIAQLGIIDDLAWELLGVALGDVIQRTPNPTDDEQLSLWSGDG